MAFDQSETKLDYTNMRNKPGLKIGQNIKKRSQKTKISPKKKIITERCGSQGMKKNFSLLLLYTSEK